MSSCDSNIIRTLSMKEVEQDQAVNYKVLRYLGHNTLLMLTLELITSGRTTLPPHLWLGAGTRTASPGSTSKRCAFAGVSAAVAAELSLDDDAIVVDMTDRLVDRSLTLDAGEPLTSPQQHAAPQTAAVVAAAHDSGKGRIGSGSCNSSKRRHKPSFVA